MSAALAWALAALALGSALLAWIWARRHRQALSRLRGLETGLQAALRRLEVGDLDDAGKGLEPGPLREALQALSRSLQSRFERDKQAQGHLVSALNGMREGVALCDGNGDVLLLNPAFSRLAGLEAPTERRYALRDVLRDPLLNQALERALKERASAQVDLPLDAGRLEGRALIAPIEAGGAVILLFDRTEERKVERLRSEFVANVSHELRTPLAAIKASLETLADGALEDPAVNSSFLNKAVRHTERLEELLADLLSLSQIEDQRRQGLKPKARCGVAEAWADAEPLLETVLRKAGTRVSAQWPADLPPVAIERGSLRQILVNYVENAVKHSGAQAPVSLGAARQGGLVEVFVQDQGQGIPHEDQARVFERFFRVDKARTRASGGSGLGLAIVKHLAENAGGSVGVQSAPGQGSRFWVRVPVAEL
jgi:two-component system, OmpR family, phosphate regulon sensor histidine kinase PhoR